MENLRFQDTRSLPCVTYTLELANKKYYVGKTWNLNQRFMEHYHGDGAVWCRKHRPKNIIDVKIGDTENTQVLDMMVKYGWENVRGGNWSSTDLSYPPVQYKRKIAELKLQQNNIKRKRQSPLK